MKTGDRHNFAKLKTLEACHFLERQGKTINSVRLRKLTKKTANQMSQILYHISVEYPYLAQHNDPEKTDGCSMKYKIKEQGRRVYMKLLSRYNQGLDLNLKVENPKPVNFGIISTHPNQDNQPPFNQSDKVS